MLGESQPIKIDDVVDVEELHSSHGLKITTKQNYISLDASHVSACYRAHLADLPWRKLSAISFGCQLLKFQISNL